MIILCILSLACSKSIISNLVLSDSDPWQSISNFGYDVGKGTYRFKARLSTPLQDRSSSVNLQFSIYLGVDWSADLLEKSCSERISKSKKTVDVALHGNTDWSTEYEGELSQKSKPHVWYFVLSDCNREIGNRKIRYEITMLNPDLNHFSIEMQGVKTIYGILIIVLALGLGNNLLTLISFFKQDEDIQATVVWVNFSIFFQIFGMVFIFAHLWIYENDGEGLNVLKFIGEGFSLISNLSITTLLIIIAGGWTLLYSDFPVPELYIPAIFLLAFLHLFIAFFSLISQGEKHSFTKYEGTSGWMIILMRLGMYFWFLYNLYWTSKEKNLRKSSFVLRFGMGASLYFLSIPLLVFGSSMFQPHLREKVVLTGVNLTQAAAFYLLSVIFTGKGEYFRINAIFSMLPGSNSKIY